MPKIPLEKIKKVLIVRPEMIGDIIILTPLVSAIKNAIPGVQITLLIQPQTEDVIKNNPEINNYIFTKKKTTLSEKIELFNIIRAEKFDLSIVFEDNPTPEYALLCFLAGIPYRIGDKARILYGWAYNYGVWLNSSDPQPHQIELYSHLLEPLAISNVKLDLQLHTDEASENEVSQILEKHDLKNSTLVGLHIGTGGGDRPLLPQTYAMISDAIQDKMKCSVVLLGGKKEVETEKKIKTFAKRPFVSLVDKLSLSGLFALMDYLNVFIGVNSGPLHAASAKKVPVVAIYVANDVRVERWLPWMTKYTIIRSKNDCKLPCKHRECTFDYCTSAVDPEEVVEAAVNLL
ncbi:MAG: glycosyltransferase family 9 protein [Candidatus Margulisbacteria bacterium]|nr:glycosyltransferase family 9 protein [Candidatus Margulisiibacteriota bacterium]MBU1022225.1 glycosyltransferase family 9 protein [Candidatus Margulisiibacteriota bacterium]MBU1729336.1 glycosyltransferase family 9 protein [Candidatus Margulisiibacteriota bacterium]MBU1955609.1 glycosyltransferase family 9 protein [Candidatus Margulisiibacteriota bacterium]